MVNMDWNVWLFDERAYFIAAVVATFIFAIKMLLLALGLDSTDAVDSIDAADVDFDADLDSIQAFTLFSLQSILAFFMGMGWAGWSAKLEYGYSQPTALIISVVVGAVLMLLSSFLLYWMKGLDRNKVFKIEVCVGKQATVYSRIPSSGQGQGKVTIGVSGRSLTLPAVSKKEEIASYRRVKVLSVNDGVLLVESMGS